jgi:hypothetical protein
MQADSSSKFMGYQELVNGGLQTLISPAARQALAIVKMVLDRLPVGNYSISAD